MRYIVLCALAAVLSGGAAEAQERLDVRRLCEAVDTYQKQLRPLKFALSNDNNPMRQLQSKKSLDVKEEALRADLGRFLFANKFTVEGTVALIQDLGVLSQGNDMLLVVDICPGILALKVYYNKSPRQFYHTRLDEEAVAFLASLSIGSKVALINGPGGFAYNKDRQPDKVCRFGFAIDDFSCLDGDEFNRGMHWVGVGVKFVRR